MENRDENGGQTGTRKETTAASDDFFVLEGATHNIEPCANCETRRGQYANCTKNDFNYLRDWITQRCR